jgi:Zn finger protein HypA/HybF involved in hydrogenase expression
MCVEYMRDRLCKDCGHTWTASVAVGWHEDAKEREWDHYCPLCEGRHVWSGPAYKKPDTGDGR